jgi:hypothetical protein
MAKRKTRRGIAESDYHTGHWAGLTPPTEWANPNGDEDYHKPRHDAQAALWNWRAKTLKEIGPVDFHFMNADLIDGRGERSGSTELQIVDRTRQVNAALLAARMVKLRDGGSRVMTRGTPYHTGQIEDFEDSIAESLDCHIGDHVYPEVNGVVFDLKHKVGSSSVPHGRMTALARQRLWNALLSGEGQHANGQPRANVLIRSHVHYHAFCGGADWLAMTLPCLQYPNSKYGMRQCDGEVTMGLTYWEITPAGNFSWKALTCQLPTGQAHTLKLSA